MLTVTQIANRFGLSRATILYYERERLLLPANRSENGYRWYGDKEIDRLEAIAAYRSYGIPIESIRHLLDQDSDLSQSQILKAHFHDLEKAINQLRHQQKAIVALLQEPTTPENSMVTKDRWVEIMRAAGFDSNAMISWHRKFEEMEPDEHQKFLESLGIQESEIKKIRKV